LTDPCLTDPGSSAARRAGVARPERPAHARAPEGLAQWLSSIDPAAEPAVRLVTIDGQICVIKRRRPSLGRGVSYALRYVRASALGLGCKVFLGEWPAPGVLLNNGLAHEARRLAQLDHAHWRVPEVWSYRPGELVLEYVGKDLPGMLRRADEAGRRTLIDHVAHELVAFHRQGLWHGGAQVRNLTWHDEAIWRIDFEENIGSALSLPLAQAYDVYQCLSSLVALRGLPVEQAEALGDQLLATYIEQGEDPGVQAALRRMARMICGAARVLAPVLGWVPGRDVQGFFRVARTLRLILKS